MKAERNSNVSLPPAHIEAALAKRGRVEVMKIGREVFREYRQVFEALACAASGETT